MKPFILKTYSDLQAKIAFLEAARAHAEKRNEMAKVTAIDFRIQDLKQARDILISEFVEDVKPATEQELNERLKPAEIASAINAFGQRVARYIAEDSALAQLRA
jgi:hypothetical protein